MIEALAYADDRERLRLVAEDFEERLAAAPEPLASVGYATVAVGYARLGDREAYATAAAEAEELVREADEAFRRLVELELSRAAAVLDDLQGVRGRVTRAEKPEQASRLLVACAIIRAQADDVDAARGLFADAKRMAARIENDTARAQAVRSVWQAQSAVGDVEAALETVNELIDQARVASAFAWIADSYRRRDPKLHRRFALLAIQRASASVESVPIEDLAHIARVVSRDPELMGTAATELVPLAERAARADPRGRWHLARVYAYVGDTDACRQELDALRPVVAAADEAARYRDLMDLEDVAQALTVAGDVTTAESLVEWVREEDHKSDVLKSIAVGHVEAGRIEEAIEMLDRPALRAGSRQIIAAVVSRALAESGQLERLLTWSDQLPTPELRRTAYRSAAEGLAGRWFLEHIMLLL